MTRPRQIGGVASSYEWPFDQGPNVSALTTTQVIDLNYPILQVVHYDDDHSWAFLCGTTSDSNDYRLVHMGEMLQRDKSLRSIADLLPGWSAWRESNELPWVREPEAPSEDENEV